MNKTKQDILLLCLSDVLYAFIMALLRAKTVKPSNNGNAYLGLPVVYPNSLLA